MSIVRVFIAEFVTLIKLLSLTTVTDFTSCALARSRVPLLLFTNVTFSTLLEFSLLVPDRLTNSILSSLAPPSITRLGFAPAIPLNLNVSLPLPPFTLFSPVDSVRPAVRLPVKLEASKFSTLSVVLRSRFTSPFTFTFLLSTPFI